MCGIAGIIHTDGKPVDRGELVRLTDTLSHRGPDGNGFHVDANVGLGHRRLAIIDLESGDQPISNEDGSVWVILNGEIYNFKELRESLTHLGHQFRTKSDTEVIVHAYEVWGVDCLSHLRGMFAFAIWDARKQQLFLARDRLGIKPICYYIGSGLFAFASELQAFRALAEFKPSLDLEALDLYLHLQYIPAPYSIYKEVRKLPPAHYLIVNRHGEIKGPIKYWDIEFHPNHRLKEDEWVERLDVALCDAVKSHLVSDVPFGAFLSGGVDSSAVVAYMSRILNTPVRTFTIGFNEAENDERNYARHVAKSLGTEHHEEVVLPDALGILPELVEHYGEPFADNSAIPAYYVSRLASQHVKMVLSGDGGDELFAGYGYYANMLRYHPVPKNLLGKSRRFAGNIARLMGLRPPLRTPPETWYGRTPYFSEEQRKNLWRKEFHYLLEATRRWNHEQFEPVKGSDLLTQCQYVDIHNYLTFNNLNKMDIASMCHGLEVRVPLVDHEFLEFAATIPPEMKLRQFSGEMGQEKISNREDPITKYILKKTVSKFFSSEFINRPKMGFSAPVPVWLGGPWQDELQSRLNSLPAALGDLFDLNYINRLTKEHPTIHDHGLRLWSLLFFAEWREQTRHRSLI